VARSSRRFDKDHISPGPKRKSKKTPRTVKGLVNARLCAFEFPETFQVPLDSTIRKLKPGNLVKVARNGERFWVRVDGFVGRKWHGTVVNELSLNEDLDYGDSIYFMRKHIYDVLIG